MSDNPSQPRTPVQVGLSTSSVYPETTSSAFELAGRLGYDGIELMVGIDPVSTDIDAVQKLRDYHQIPVLSVHAPCLLISQHIWGNDNWAKLERSAKAARQLDADVVVVHPPFRWQREYARDFVSRLRDLSDRSGVRFCLENMYPWRIAGTEMKAYLPQWDPSELEYEDLTLDFSHASTAGQQSLELAKTWGDRLGHVHLTDGTGSMKDEHLVPGRGNQHAGAVLQHLVGSGFSGHVVLEVNSRRSGTRAQREIDLSESLAFARMHLERAALPAFAGDTAGTADVLS
ncbi:sugar phosphate isomerase/epimerase family protein [Microlunatus soli]|uniref:Sugar phosphate isomerase/epimerase n=1 Tax=Microlunatus soli TaxID=630515 RepID=A0A1H1SEG9_9ACTN|nr:sugar phosphate isomerase/epimerase [Microlunatus soli]SDS46126.1 Sugar phosphate isomerase/epimerase [Microlunatus soli]